MIKLLAVSDLDAVGLEKALRTIILLLVEVNSETTNVQWLLRSPRCKETLQASTENAGLAGLRCSGKTRRTANAAHGNHLQRFLSHWVRHKLVGYTTQRYTVFSMVLCQLPWIVHLALDHHRVRPRSAISAFLTWWHLPNAVLSAPGTHVGQWKEALRLSWYLTYVIIHMSKN